jgi:hypothetical protein
LGIELLDTIFFDLNPDERKIIRKGKRGCSADLSQLKQLCEKCFNAGMKLKAASWSIFPIIGATTVYVEYYNVPNFGLCNSENRYGRYYDPDRGEVRSKRLWFDERPIPEFVSPSSGQAVKDRTGKYGFDPEAE